MNKSIVMIATVFCLLLATPGYAVDPAGNIPRMMGQMHKHMRHMQILMERIQKAEDEEEYQNLMHEHMQGMHQGMKMMRDMMDERCMNKECPMIEGKQMAQGMDKDCPMMDGDNPGPGMKQCPMKEGGGMGMHCRMMSERMDMMQMMMEQMMQHQQAYQFRHRHGN